MPYFTEKSPEVSLEDASQPYFLQSFLSIIDHVSNEPSFNNLFNNADRDCVNKFTNLTGKS